MVLSNSDYMYRPIMNIPHIGVWQELNVHRFKAELAACGYKFFKYTLYIVVIVGLA